MSPTQSSSSTGASIGSVLRLNLSTAELYEDAIRAGEGLVAAEGPLVVRTGRHTGRSPEDKFIVREASSQDKIWWGTVNRPISRGALRAPPASAPGIRGEAPDLRPGPVHRGRARPIAARCGSTPRRPGPASSPGTCSVDPIAADLAGLPAQLHDHQRALVQGRPGHRGHPDRDRDPAPPQADGGHHRRHRVRRRDQEECLHGHELPDAGRGHPADALGRSTSAGPAIRPSSSACRGPARRPCRRIPSGA